ncbi:MAG: acetylornithine deacetylase [Acidimicrobiia bacterium]
MDTLAETTLILGDLVGFPTVTSESNLELIDYLVNRLEPLGADIRLTHDAPGSKANLFATIGPPIDGGIVLSGHSDVVPADEPDWTGGPFIAMLRDQRIYGRGTTDMKGFLACAVAMASEFATAPLRRPVHIAVTFDEEVGCRGAPILLDDLARAGIKPAAAVVGEPTGMSVVTAHKGMHEYTTTITGRESHASLPAHGVNAVHYGTRYVSRLLELASALEERAPDASPYDPPHTTISVGTISGGMARNVVAAECVVEWEMRPINRGDADFVMDAIGGFEESLLEEMRLTDPEASIVTISEGAVAGLEQDDDSHAVRLVSDLVGGPGDVVSFGSEAGLYQAAGISSVVCGPGDIDVAHRPNEYIGLDQLAGCLDFMQRLIVKLLKG